MEQTISQGNRPKAPPELLAVQRIAWWTDGRWRIPFTRIRLGLDGLLGLIPVIGDALSLLPALRILWLAKRIGAPFGILLLMLKNLGLDFLFGLVPVIGDIIDIGYRANSKNATLLTQWWMQQQGAKIRQFTQQQLTELQIGDD